MALQCILPEHSKNNLNSHFNLNDQDLGKSTAKNLLIISIPICESEIQTFCENLLKFKKINVIRNVQVKRNGMYKQGKVTAHGMQSLVKSSTAGVHTD